MTEQLTCEKILSKWGSMTPRERDAWIAEVVFGWKPLGDGRMRSSDGFMIRAIPEYSTDIPAAWGVIRNMQNKGYDFAIESLNDSLNAGGDLYHVRFFKRLEGNYYEYDSEVSVMHGISICALLAVLGEEKA